MVAPRKGRQSITSERAELSLSSLCRTRYSFADREWDYVVDYCERNGIAFIPWFPLGGGKVAGEVLNRIAQAHEGPVMQLGHALV
jgi:aryl-alcohol dehydrogenase-like predicted oxidoreductase